MKSGNRASWLITFAVSCLGWANAETTIHYFGVFCDAYEGEGGAINESVTRDRLTVRKIFNQYISPQGWEVRVRQREINGENARKETIMREFAAFTQNVGSNDTVYVHFSGHGVIQDAARGEQFLETCDSQLVSRETWANQIERLPCRLKIFITDCCSSYPPSEVVEGADDVDPWSNLYYLLMRHWGFVNITAASPGQAAYGTPAGGFLTVNLESDVQRYRTWKEVFEATQQRVFDETLEEIRNLGADELKPQRPFAYSLGEPRIDLAPDESLPAGLQYVIPDSNRRALTRVEIENMDMQQMYLARNEIFARHGYDFKTQILRDYFSSRDWYQFTPGFKTPKLSQLEKRNVGLILEVEKESGGPFVVTSSATPDQNPANQAPPDIFAYSSERALSRTVVQTLTLPELSIARNEIFARHGYPFRSKVLQDFFALKPYYRRDPNATNPQLNAVEKHNLWLIRKLERLKGGQYQW